MMMRIIAIILIISLFVFGCKTKKIDKYEEKIEQKETVKEKTEVKEHQEEKVSIVKKSDETVKKDNKEENKSVEIKGKTDEKNPLTYYNVVNGDTIDLFKVTGNADVIFKSFNKSSNSNSNSNSSTNYSEDKKSDKKSGSVIEKASEVVSEVQQKTVQVVKKDFTFGTYLTFFLWGLAIIIVLVIIFWLRKQTFFTKFFK